MLVESFSGIRGVYGPELTLDIAKKYAHAYYCVFLNKNPKDKIKIAIGRDSRDSGKDIFNSMCSVLNCEILDLGISSTPIIENAVSSFGCNGGIIITGSHNEPEYNGFKFLDKNGAILNPNEIQKVIKEFHRIKEFKDLKIDLSKQRIENYKDSSLGSYIGFLRGILGESDLNGIRILIDPNGGAGVYSKPVFDEFKVDAVYVNMNIGNFNRLIEPNLDSLKMLQDKIISENIEFGAGFDCDADRAEIFLNNGQLVSGNQILAIISDEILSNHNKPIVVNDATSYLIKEIAEKHNSKYIEVEVGETNVISKMDELGSVVGGEGSNGGIIIKGSKCRDGVLGVLYLLKILLNKNKKLNDLIDELPKYYYLKEKINLSKDFDLFKEKIIDYYSKKGFDVLKTGYFSEGLKFVKDNSWVWFRQSKTEDKVLRIIVDSKDEIIANKLLDEGKGLIERSN